MTEFQRDTNWYVFTGAPSSGKTSVLDALAQKGLHVESETARTYIEQQIELGRPLDHVRSDATGLQYGILHTKLIIERRLPAKELIFLDRAIPDSIAYFRLCGLPDDAAIKASHTQKYRKVFMFERLPIKHDNIRTENEEEAAWLDQELRKVYQELGYPLIDVPVMPVEERVRFILDQLGR